MLRVLCRAPDSGREQLGLDKGHVKGKAEAKCRSQLISSNVERRIIEFSYEWYKTEYRADMSSASHPRSDPTSECEKDPECPHEPLCDKGCCHTPWHKRSDLQNHTDPEPTVKPQVEQVGYDAVQGTEVEPAAEQTLRRSERIAGRKRRFNPMN
jgi:hypothetical protein